jgi:hypothetical protein
MLDERDGPPRRAVAAYGRDNAHIGEVCRVLKREGQAYEWTLVISLALVFGFVGLNRAGIGFVMPPIVQEFHLEFWQAGLLISGTSLTWAIAAWLSGSISDRVGRKNGLLDRHVRGLDHLVPDRSGLELPVAVHPARPAGAG